MRARRSATCQVSRFGRGRSGQMAVQSASNSGERQTTSAVGMMVELRAPNVGAGMGFTAEYLRWVFPENRTR